jgi:type IV secretory pathway VirD2 relaxase
MDTEDGFELRPGRIGRDARLMSQGHAFRNQVIRVANLARGGRAESMTPAGRSGFTGERIGRGSGAGRVLASRKDGAGFRHRRVMVKARIVKLAGKGRGAAAAHLRYVQRDGVTRAGDPGVLYDAHGNMADGKAFLNRAEGDRHQFRFIVSPEDGAQYEDLKSVTRRLMTQMEADLGTRLDWVAVDHFNTGHPHTHILVRGKDELAKDLVIAKSYITDGIRERASEIVSLDLGPRTQQEIDLSLKSEMTQDRYTSLDRWISERREDDGRVRAVDADPQRQSLISGRLNHLEDLGLASPDREGHW